MSKKNKWRKITPAAQLPTSGTEPRPQEAETRDALVAPTPSTAPISPAQFAANRTNALLSTGPRTEAGIAKSSKNAVKSALTGRTVLLPTDDVEEYGAFLEGFQHDLKPVGQTECELVQIIVDCYWRLRRIQEIEYALYAHGERQFEQMFSDEPAQNRRSMIVLQTHLTYQKELRNLHIQEGRIDRKRAKALAELQNLQCERKAAAEHTPASLTSAQPIPSTSLPENGFVFSSAHLAAGVSGSRVAAGPTESRPAASGATDLFMHPDANAA